MSKPKSFLAPRHPAQATAQEAERARLRAEHGAQAPRQTSPARETAPRSAVPAAVRFRALHDWPGSSSDGTYMAHERDCIGYRMEYLQRVLEDNGGTLLASEQRELDHLASLHAAYAAHPKVQALDSRRGKRPHALAGTDPADELVAKAYGVGRPIAKDQTFVGYARNVVRDLPVEVLDAMDAAGSEELSLSKYLKGVITGQWDDARAERVLAAHSGASGVNGGHLIPTLLSTQLIDLARNQTRVLQAGATVVPMANRTLDVPRWITDPTVAWRGEEQAINESQGGLDKITLQAKTLAGLAKASRELLEDTDIDKQLEFAFASAVALAWDMAALYGTGANSQPKGLRNVDEVIKTPIGGANGATPTNFDFLVDSVGRLRDVNEDPNAMVMADRTQRTLAKLKDSTAQPLQPPSYLDGLTRYATNQVPINATTGTSNDTTDVFVGDWSKLLLGVRTQVEIGLLKERYADTGQVGFLVWFRGDVAVARPKAFNIVTGIRP